MSSHIWCHVGCSDPAEEQLIVFSRGSGLWLLLSNAEPEELDSLTLSLTEGFTLSIVLIPIVIYGRSFYIAQTGQWHC